MEPHRSTGHNLGVSVQPDDDGTPGGGARRVLAPDARAAAAELERRVAAHVAAWRADPASPPPDLWICVPDAPARRWCLARLAGAGALVGVEVRTAVGLALELCERARLPDVHGRELFAIHSRRAARSAGGLWEALGSLERGTDAIARSLGTLLESGIEPDHVDALCELLAQGADATDPQTVRTTELVKIAGHLAHMAQGPAALFRRAIACLGDPNAWRPRALCVHGFRESRGLVGAFTDELVELDGACEIAVGSAPSRRTRAPLPAAAAGELVLRHAAGLATEVLRAVEDVAQAVHVDGVAPEHIALCAYGAERYLPSLREQLVAFGVPFHGAGLPGPTSAAGRALLALCDVLTEGGRVRARRILAIDRRLEPARGERVALALELLGTTRLDAWAELDVRARLGERTVLPLPLALGAARPTRDELAGTEDEAAEGPAQELDRPQASEQQDSPRPTRIDRGGLARDELERSCTRARDLLDTWRELDERPGTAADAARTTLELVRVHLGWEGREPALALVEREVAGLAAALEPGFELESGDEWCTALAERLRARAREPLGGPGSGVQLARPEQVAAHAWERIYVLGLDVQHAPRRQNPDALLPAPHVRTLRDVLPDLPLAEEAAATQHAAFRDLCRGAPRVWISRAGRDLDGRALEPSTWWTELDTAAQELHVRARGGSGPLPVLERAGDLLLEAGGTALARCIELCAPPFAPAERTLVAKARGDLAIELDRAPREAARLGPGPFHGLLGPCAGDDREERALYVTTMEGLATCGWRTFLERLLPLEPVPDVESSLPALEQGLVGQVVHDVLEHWAKRAPTDGERPAAPPDPETLERWCIEKARTACFEAGLPLPGYARAYAVRARPLVERALALGGPTPMLLGAEQEGTVRVDVGSGAPLVLHFRVDRLERAPNAPGGRLLTDYKTGAPPKREASRIATVREHLERDVARGRRLQAAAYALSEAGSSGRYLFLTEREVTCGDEGRVLTFERGEGAWEVGFGEALSHLAAAWRAGVFAPRLVGADGKEPKACSWCEVSDACLRDDSGVRRTFEAWSRRDPGPKAEDPTTQAFLAWLDLDGGART